MMRRQHKGFTLLEVLVALAIVSMSLGTIMALAGGSKRLAFTAEARIANILYSRAATSSAQASYKKPKYPEFPVSEKKNLTIKKGDLLEKSERQTKKILYALEHYEVQAGGKVLSKGLRWKRLKSNR